MELRHKGLDVVHVPFIGSDRAYALLAALVVEADWHRPTMRMYGKVVHTRRQVAWHADEGYTYSYSGQTHVWRDWTPAMVSLRRSVEDRMGMGFDGVLLNMYASVLG